MNFLYILQLVVHQIRGNNHPRASQGAALDHVEPHTTTTDHHRAAAGFNLRGINRRAHAGHDPTTNQTSFVERHVVGNLDAGRLIDDRILREAREPSHMVKRLAILLEPAAAIE